MHSSLRQPCLPCAQLAPLQKDDSVPSQTMSQRLWVRLTGNQPGAIISLLFTYLWPSTRFFSFFLLLFFFLSLWLSPWLGDEDQNDSDSGFVFIEFQGFIYSPGVCVHGQRSKSVPYLIMPHYMCCLQLKVKPIISLLSPSHNNLKALQMLQ